MPVPDFQSFFRPLLEFSSDGADHSMKEARDALALSMRMTEADLRESLPSGIQTKFDNRVAWAKTYLLQAGALDSPKRGYFRITERGREILKRNTGKIDNTVLNQFPEFKEFHSPKSPRRGTTDQEEQTSETPEEVFQRSYERIKTDLAAELLERIKRNTPAFFERLVVDFMIALGYGGSRADAGKSVGQSGDEGIDGIIKEDRLGLDIVYLQAKRWEGCVGRPEIQRFVGALHGKRAKKGVFITTGKFSADAFQYVATIDPKVILIDGRSLAEMMIDHNVAVSVGTTYQIKKVDNDYFLDD
jgi:restriction system protein